MGCISVWRREGRWSLLTFKGLFSSVGLVERLDEPAADDGEDDARQQLDDDAVDPEVDVVQQLVVLQRHPAEPHVVQNKHLIILAHHRRLYLEHEVRWDANYQGQGIADAYRQVAPSVGTQDMASLWKPETIRGTL